MGKLSSKLFAFLLLSISSSLFGAKSLDARRTLKVIPIVVVIPSYNNKDWYKRNLDSVFNQKYHNYRVIYLDDASPDGTGPLVKGYIKEKKQNHRVKFIQNEKRVGALANTYRSLLAMQLR